MKIFNIRLSILLSITFFANVESHKTYGQDSNNTVNVKPIMVEPMINDNGLFIQTLLNKPIKSIKNVNFLNINSFTSKWDDYKSNALMMQMYFTYSLNKKLTVNTGFH